MNLPPFSTATVPNPTSLAPRPSSSSPFIVSDPPLSSSAPIPCPFPSSSSSASASASASPSPSTSTSYPIDLHLSSSPPRSAASAFADASSGRIRIVNHRADIASPPIGPTLSRRPVHHQALNAMSRKVSHFVSTVLNDPAGESNPSASNASFSSLPPSTSSLPNSSTPFIGSHPSPRPGSTYSSASITSSLFYPTQDHGVSRAEIWRMVANRIYFSQFYKIIYVSTTLLALIAIILSFINKCPTTFFLALECIVNLTLIVEVGIRFLATRRQFFNSKANILDVILVFLCLSLLGMLLHDAKTCKTGASDPDDQRTEALIDSILLIIRNVLQLARIFNMLRKNQNQLNARVASVDFTGLEEGNHDPLLFDADDEQLGFGNTNFAQKSSILPR